ARSLPHPGAAGASDRDPQIQAGGAVADERCDGASLWSEPVSAKPAIARGFRLQWEPAQNCHVLLYPEGMVKLNGSAGEIMTRCAGERSIEAIVGELESGCHGDGRDRRRTGERMPRARPGAGGAVLRRDRRPAALAGLGVDAWPSLLSLPT